MSVAVTKMQLNGPEKKESRKNEDKNEIRKWDYHYNIITVLLKSNEKCKLLLLKCSLTVKTKRNQERVVGANMCLYGKTK